MLVSSPLAYAEKISIRLSYSRLELSGEFPFQLNQPLKIQSYDQDGNAFQLEINAKPRGEEFAYIEYKLSRNKKIGSGSILAKIGERSSLQSGENGKEPDIKFEVKIQK
jgi:hypothetical protein